MPSPVLKLYEHWLAELQATPDTDEHYQAWAGRKNAREAARYPLLAAVNSLEPVTAGDLLRGQIQSVGEMVALLQRFAEETTHLRELIRVRVTPEAYLAMEQEAESARYLHHDEAFAVEWWRKKLCAVDPEQGYVECPHARPQENRAAHGGDMHHFMAAMSHKGIESYVGCPVCGWPFARAQC